MRICPHTPSLVVGQNFGRVRSDRCKYRNSGRGPGAKLFRQSGRNPELPYILEEQEKELVKDEILEKVEIMFFVLIWINFLPALINQVSFLFLG